VSVFGRDLRKEEGELSRLAAGQSAVEAFWARSRGSNVELLACRQSLEAAGLSAKELRGLKVGLPNLPEGTTTGNRIHRLRDLLDDLLADLLAD